MATVLITGGTGLVGKALSKALVEKGYEVIILTRDPAAYAAKKEKGISYAGWDIPAQTMDHTALGKADYIIHLAGAGVADQRWTAKRKQEIVNSRVQSGTLLVKALESLPENQVKAVISASAIGWYGPDTGTGKAFVETDAPATDFLGETCRQWEAATEPVANMGKRLVRFRIGIVLSERGGAMKEFLKPLRFGVAAILGSGKQVISWIHIDDLVRLFLFALENEKLSGVYNAVSPAPVTNRQLVLQLARKRNRFYIPFRVPSFLLRWMLGEMSVEVLKSTTVSATKVLETGFRFQHNALESIG